MRAEGIAAGLYFLALGLTVPNTLPLVNFIRPLLLILSLSSFASLVGAGIVTLLVLVFLPILSTVSLPSASAPPALFFSLVFLGLVEELLAGGMRTTSMFGPMLLMLSPEARKGMVCGIGSGLVVGAVMVVFYLATGSIFKGFLAFIGMAVYGPLFGISYGLLFPLLSRIRPVFGSLMVSALWLIPILLVCAALGIAPVGVFLAMLANGALFGLIWEKAPAPTWFVPVRAV